jgi:hypothetical protein
MSAIDDLVAEYNAAEAAQSVRRLALFRLLDARTGYRAVKFAGKGIRAWINCWGFGPEYLWKPRFVDVMDQSITAIDPGQEA